MQQEILNPTPLIIDLVTKNVVIHMWPQTRYKEPP